MVNKLIIGVILLMSCMEKEKVTSKIVPSTFHIYHKVQFENFKREKVLLDNALRFITTPSDDFLLNEEGSVLWIELKRDINNCPSGTRLGYKVFVNEDKFYGSYVSPIKKECLDLIW